jgi:hypothetical protein
MIISKIDADRVALSERTLATWSEMRAAGTPLTENLRLMEDEIAFLRRGEDSPQLADLVVRWETLATQVRNSSL